MKTLKKESKGCEINETQFFEDKDHEYSTFKEMTNLYAASMICNNSEEYFAMSCVAGKTIEKVDFNNIPKECIAVLDITKDYVNNHHDYSDNWIENLRSLAPEFFEKYIDYINRDLDVKCKQEAFSAFDIFANQSIRNWHNMIFKKEGNIVGYDLIMLPIAMFDNINVRDTLLVDLLDSKGEYYNIDSLLTLAFEPRTKEISKDLRCFLEEKFNEEHELPDICKALDVVNLLKAMACVVDGIPELKVQVYALMCYISWWFRLGDVEKYVEMALDIDPDCSMVRIVDNAYRNHVEPAWCRKFATPQEESNNESSLEDD
ncbi:hypothetical protein ACMZ79_01115 [Gardnerella vaginalis]|uniref:hypothetical protein n=1 Tax=Gardnerella vaginalis TaxID=2702 RepID=UPI0039EE1B65